MDKNWVKGKEEKSQHDNATFWVYKIIFLLEVKSQNNPSNNVSLKSTQILVLDK